MYDWRAASKESSAFVNYQTHSLKLMLSLSRNPFRGTGPGSPSRDRVGCLWPWWARLDFSLTSCPLPVEETSASQDESDNSVSESLDDCDYSVAEISRSFRSQQELCEQLNINHMIQRIFLITLDNSK